MGLEAARKVAQAWAENAEKQFGMTCTVSEGQDSDVVEFTRAGATGHLTVTADRFDVDVELGMLLRALAGTIKAQIEQQLDGLLQAGREASSRAPGG